MLVLFNELIIVYSENVTKHIGLHGGCGQNAEILMLKHVVYTAVLTCFEEHCGYRECSCRKYCKNYRREISTYWFSHVTGYRKAGYSMHMITY